MKYDISFKEEGKGKGSCNNTESYNLPRRGDRLNVYRYGESRFPTIFWAEVVRVEWNDLVEGSVTVVVKEVEK